MKVLVLYRERSDHARRIEEFARDLAKRNRSKIDLVSIDSRDGYSTASLYDVVQYPAILVTTDYGQLMKVWQGKDLPMMDEVAYFASR